MAHRSSIRLSASDDACLREMYVAWNIPTDQYKRRPEAAQRFIVFWYTWTGRTDSWGEVLHYMMTKRKGGTWPCLGDGHERLADLPRRTLSDAEWRHLEAAYTAVVVQQLHGSDELLYSETVSAALSREFARLSGRVVSGSTLAGLVLARRKRGEWVTVVPRELPDVGWGDMDQVA